MALVTKSSERQQYSVYILNECECVFIYCTYHIVSQGGLQFYLSEIGRQLVEVPLAAAFSPYLISPTQPMHEMYYETMTLQIDHNTGNYAPYSFREVCGFFNIPC